MTTVAVVAHAGKSLGGGLGELRDVLAREGFANPLWFEVTKSKFAPARAREAVAGGADLVFVWGGDGTVQRCIDALAGTGLINDVAVASFNDISAAQFLNPPLSTVRLPSEEIGETAVELLLDRIAGRDIAKRITLASRLIWRASTRHPAAV